MMPSPRASQKWKSLLALAIANGASVVAWAHGNEVPKPTAYRWAAEPNVRATVESCRRRALDQAVGRMAKRVTWAADEIAELARMPTPVGEAGGRCGPSCPT